jgi:DMSO/TMAO reductase YedYZ molybdopterin-dependent catalytic subunit
MISLFSYQFKKGVIMDRKILIILLVVIIAALLFVAVEYQKESSTVKLSGVEVKDYHGQKLSSVNDFRENSIKGPQYINISNYQLEITGQVQNPRNYTYDEVLNHTSYEKVVSLDCVEGWDVTILWQGILISDLLKESKPLPTGTTVIFYANDNYTTSFPIEYLYDKQILLAYKMNNVTIPPERGYPFMVVAESKWGYKWIKWVTKIEVSNNTSYQGYWESRGYSNNGDLNQNFLGGS